MRLDGSGASAAVSGVFGGALGCDYKVISVKTAKCLGS